ncbi:uncharacterized mitochondrial protein-like protein, partial [Tanacetum coccineum]
ISNESSMGELIFFLGLQVKQNKEGIFISQDKYVAEILKKFDLVHVKAAITPMETKLPLTKDEEAFDLYYLSLILVVKYAGQEHAAQAQTQPLPPPPPIPTTTSPTPSPIPTPTSPPPPPPKTEPPTDEHIYEEQSPVHHHFSPSQAQAPSHMPIDDLLQIVPKLISRIDSLELDLKQTKLTMGNAIVKLVKKVKKLEGFLKRRNLVLTDSEDEEPERRKESTGKKVVSNLDFQEDNTGAEKINTTVLLVKIKDKEKGKLLCSVKKLQRRQRNKSYKKKQALQKQ